MRLTRCLAAARPIASSTSVAMCNHLPAMTSPPLLFRPRQQRRTCASTRVGVEAGQTQLAAYLEASGAVWASAAEVHCVETSEDNRSMVWRVDLSQERLATLRHGDLLESPPFRLLGGEEGHPEVRA